MCLEQSVHRQILVPFMHMRGFGSGAGYNAQAKEDQIGAGSEIEIWNIDDTRPLTITEMGRIVFRCWMFRI